MESIGKEIEKSLLEGARRLVSRADESHLLTPESLVPRIAGSVQKYLLRFDSNASQQEIAAFIDELQATDLCLVVACEQGNEDAWNELVNRFTPTVRSAARSASSNEDIAEDLVQSIWAELYGLRSGKDGKPASKLAYYSGRGSLAGWLRAVVGQLAVDAYRKQARLVQTEEDAELDRMVQETSVIQNSSLASGHLKSHEETIANTFAKADLQKALIRSIKELDGVDRLLVKLYYFDGLRLREAGAVLGVHEATASRRLNRVHVDLRKQVTEILIKEHGWTKAEAERSFAEVAQHLDTDLETLLSNESVP